MSTTLDLIPQRDSKSLICEQRLILNRMSTVLRPHLYREIKPVHRTAHARFFAAFQRRCSHTPADSFWSSTSFNHRLAELRDAQKIREKEGNAFPSLLYPRMPRQSARNIDIYTFVKGFGHLNAGGLKKHRDKSFCVNGIHNLKHHRSTMSDRLQGELQEFVRRDRSCSL